MDVTHESAQGEGLAVDGFDEAAAEDLRTPQEASEAEGNSPSPLDEFDSADLLKALEPDEVEVFEEEENDDASELEPDEAEAGEQWRDGAAGEAEVFVEPEYEEPQEVAGDSGDAAAEIQDRIRSLREQRRQAIDDFDRPSEARLTEEIEDLQLDLLRAEQAGQAREAQARNYQESYLSAVDAMEARYPEALDEQSAFHRILDNKIAAAQARRDPALVDPGLSCTSRMRWRRC